MASAGTVVITMDADVAKVVEGIKKTNKSISDFQYKINKSKDKLASLAKAAGAFYVVKKGVDLATSSIHSMLDTASQFENYTNRMSAFTQGQAQANAEVDRGVAFAKQYKTSINDTMDSLLIMKNYGLDDSNESLKIFTNTAIGSGKSLSQYAEAVADALTGENERLKEFGLKASVQGQKIGYVWTDSLGKTRNIVIENNKEIINSTLNAIMNEKYVGQIEKRATSWAGMMQGMSTDFTIFKKNIADEGLFDYFKQLGDGISTIFTDSFNDGSLSAKQFSDDTISFMGAIIKAIGFVAKALAGIANLARVVYGGINELRGSIGMAINIDSDSGFKQIKELEERLSSLGDVDRRGNSTSRQKKSIEQSIASIKAEIKVYEEYKDIRISGEKSIEAAAKSQANINKLIDSVTSLATKNSTAIKKSTHDISAQKEAATKALNAVIAANGQADTSTKKATKTSKSQANAIKDAAQEIDKLSLKYAEITNQTSLVESMQIDKVVAEFEEAGYAANKLLEIKNALKQDNLDKFDKEQSLEAPTIVEEVFNPYLNLIESQKEYIKNIQKAGKDQYRIDKINAKHTSEQLKGYAGLANGMKGFFKEGSRGYKGMETAQKTLQAFEFAWFLKKEVLEATGIATKLANIGADTTATVASEATKSSVIGVNAVLTQGQGDPYTAWARMAAMAAVVAGLGVAISGGTGSGGRVSEQELEDARGVTEFSESIVNSIESLESIELQGLAKSSEMLSQLKQLVSLSEKTAASIGISKSDLTGNNYQGNNSAGFWNDHTEELVATGIEIYETTMQEILDGHISVNKYMVERIQDSGWLGIGSSDSLRTTDLGSAEGSISDPLTKMYQLGIDAQKNAAEALGISGAEFLENSKDWHTSLQRLNFEGKSETEIAEMLNGAISNDLDNLAKSIMPALESFRAAGEGLMETLVRLGVQHEAVTVQLSLFGQAATDFAGSNALVEAAGGLAKFQSSMDTFTENFFSEEEQQAMLKSRLEMALLEHDVALPASKAAYRALVLETQGKILAVQTQIDARKAEIRSQIEAGTFAQNNAKARAEVEKFVQNNMLLTGEAAVVAGKNFKIGFDNMTDAAQEAVKFDADTGEVNIDFSSLGDAELNALEATKSQLSGLYGSLLDNAGAFASMADAAIEGLTALEAKMLDIAKFKAELTDDKVEGARLILESTTKKTGLTELTTTNILSEMNKNMDAISSVSEETTSYASSCSTAASSCSLAASSCDSLSSATENTTAANNDLLSMYKEQYYALKAYEDALAEVEKKKIEAVQTEISFYDDLVKRVQDSYTGSLSYLNNIEKTAYLERLGQTHLDNNDTNSYLEVMKQQLETEKKTSRTREEYSVKFDRYINELQEQKPQKTTDDVVETLETITEKLRDIEDRLEESKYQELHNRSA